MEGTMTAIWKDCPDLMRRLEQAQGSGAFEHQDITFWAAMCDTREELERHVVNCEQRAANFVPPVRRRRKAA
jgi:hypothetical protein